MALPTTTYDTSTMANPVSALTDFTLMIDLSRMSAAWWTANGTEADGTKGRAAKDDGTELATDWIDFNHAAETGWVRVKWSGTLATSGTQTIRVYPPVAGNSANAVSATYGSDNAYDANWEGYWPNGGGADRTSSDNDGTANGGVAVGGVAGQAGKATDFDGVNDYITLADPSLTANLTVMAWITAGASSTVAEHAVSFNPGFTLGLQGSSQDMRFEVGATGFSEAVHPTNPDGTFRHYCGTYDSSDTIAYYNSTAGTAVTDASGNIDVTGDLAIGSFAGNPVSETFAWDGIIQEVQIHSAARHADWIKYEYDQTNDNATFLGTWEVVAAASSALGSTNLLKSTLLSSTLLSSTLIRS